MARPQTSWRRWHCAAAICVLALAQAASAQELPDFGGFKGLSSGPRGAASDPATFEAQFTPATADEPALLFVTAKIDRGYHMNAVDQPTDATGGGPQATKIKLDEKSGARLLGPFVAIDEPRRHIDTKAWPGLELREHEGRVTWVAPVELPAGVDAASLTLAGSIDGQACDDRSCVPIDATFTAKADRGVPLPPGIKWSKTGELAGTGPPAAIAPTTGAVDAGSSLWLVAVYGMLGGVILNLMPCVLPVIGLKVLTFAKQGGQSRRHILGLNVAYAAGVLTVFMVLATLATLVQLGLGSESFGWGELNTFTWFKVSMTALVFAMALAFLGVWEIPIPGFASSSKATELSAQEGPFGAFCMGVFTTLLATPCSGPFLGPVFGYTITQPPAVTYLVFGSVGVGMALPYLAIGAFPALVSWLPKPGEWMDTLKQLLGFVLLATVVYLFSTISPEYFLPTLALLFSIWFGCWIVGRTPLWAEASFRRRAWMKGIAAAAVLGGGSFAIFAPSEAELPWQPYSAAALAEARAQGKTVLVDFTANWCLTCKLNLKLAINRQDVRDLVERNGVVPMIADWTDRNGTIKQALAELNSRSIPLLAIYPAAADSEVVVLPDVITQGTLLSALEQAGPSLETAAARRGTKTAARLGNSSGNER